MGKYTNGLTYDEFLDNDLVSDAVIKNVLVIGEAVKKIPEETRETHPHIEWRKMAGMRDMMIHGYFSINYRISGMLSRIKSRNSGSNWNC
ncbi:DUF86 domain-containing protein [Cytobacillus firmus]